MSDSGVDLISDFSLAERDRIVLEVSDPLTFDVEQLRIIDDGQDIHLVIGDQEIVIGSFTSGGFAVLGVSSIDELNALSQAMGGYDMVVFA